MYLNDKEEKIIGEFFRNLKVYSKKEMVLIWENKGIVLAKYDTCFEDDNDLEETDSEYEEFFSVSFEAIKGTGDLPVTIMKSGFFLVNYHNFPDIIMVNGKKIN